MFLWGVFVGTEHSLSGYRMMTVLEFSSASNEVRAFRGRTHHGVIIILYSILFVPGHVQLVCNLPCTTTTTTLVHTEQPYHYRIYLATVPPINWPLVLQNSQRQCRAATCTRRDSCLVLAQLQFIHFFFWLISHMYMMQDNTFGGGRGVAFYSP